MQNINICVILNYLKSQNEVKIESSINKFDFEIQEMFVNHIFLLLYRRTRIQTSISSRIMASTASAPVVHVFETSLMPDDIGNFIGPRGSSLRNYVIKASTRDAESAGISCQHLNIRVHPVDADGTPKVVVTIKTSSEEMRDIVVANLTKHEKAFLRKKSAPKKPSVIQIVFKTAMEDHHQGKYVGSGGKNITRVLHDCTAAIATATDGEASSVRVRISEDRFLRKGSYFKLFTIRNNAQTENQVLITVSCIYEGSPGKIFSAVKPVIIDSVVNMFPPPPEEIESAEMDFLGGAFSMNYTTNPSPAPTLVGMEEPPSAGGADDDPIQESDSPGYCPPSPTYSPGSPTYSPDSPTYTPSSP